MANAVQRITVLDAANVAWDIFTGLPQGQANNANSAPVVLSSDQPQVNVGAHLLTGLLTGANVIGAITQSGNWTVRTADGAGNALTSKLVGSERAISVAIMDTSGAQINSFGAASTSSAGLHHQSANIVPTIQASAYAANNCIGGKQTIPVFRTTSPASGRITGVSVVTLGGEEPPFNIYIFSKDPTLSTFTDKSTFAVHNTDSHYLERVISITPSVLPGTAQKMGYAELNLPIVNKDTSVSNNIYVAIEVGAAVTPTGTSNLILKFRLIQD